MITINEVTIAGHLTANAKTGTTKEGKPYVTFSVALNKRVGDQWQIAAYVDVVKWNADESLGGLIKGDGVCVHGQIETGSYTSKEGSKVKRTQINARLVTVETKVKQSSNFDNFNGDSEEEIPF